MSTLYKLPRTGDTIFTVMSQLAHEHNALNMAQGFPDFPVSGELIDLVIKYMRHGANQYSPMPGVMALREAIAWKTESLYGVKVDPVSEITVTCGATEACNVAITAFIRPGDEVIVFEPAFDCYRPVIELHGGRPVFVELEHPDYSINWEEVGKRITSSTRMIIVNSPHNPTGAVLKKEDLDKLAKLVGGTQILILSDEVYEHIVFDGVQHESAMTHPDLWERSLIMSSLGKTFHVTGWRVGYCIAPKHLSAEFRKVHQYATFSASTPAQYALAEYLQKPEHYLGLSDFFQQKRNLFLQNIKSSPFKEIPSRGTYFQLLSYKEFSSENDVELAKRLTREYGIASIPVSVFYNQKTDHKVLRFCFAKEDSTLSRAAEILCKLSDKTA